MDTPNPPRRSLFAVWRWPRWTWGVLVMLAFVGYVLSPPVTVQLMVRGVLGSTGYDASRVIQYPLYKTTEHMPALHQLYQSESELIDRTLGNTGYVIFWTSGGHGIIR